MEKMSEIISTTIHVFAVATDWILIVLGILLVLVAVKSIDVQVARYAVIGAGVFLTGIGFWYRFSRLHKKSL
jgi:uncharacterized membrane protein